MPFASVITTCAPVDPFAPLASGGSSSPSQLIHVMASGRERMEFERRPPGNRRRANRAIRSYAVSANSTPRGVLRLRTEEERLHGESVGRKR
jgi:hypothetical protein